MARLLIVGLVLVLGLPINLLAGQITEIKTVKKTQDEIEIAIEGSYGAYQGIGLRSPARFVIDFQEAFLSESVAGSLPVEGSIVSQIKTAAKGNDVRIVLESVDKEKLFHCTMHDREGMIIVKCWMPEENPEMPVQDAFMEEVGDVPTPPSLPKKELSDLFGWQEKQETTESIDELGEKKLSKYTGQKITLDFYKTELHNVFRLFAEMSGKNFIIDENVKGDLTLSLKEVPWDSAMDLILDLKDLVKEEKLETTIIKPRPVKEETGKGELVVKKFSEEILQPARILKEEKENRGRAQNMILNAHNFETMGKTDDALSQYEQAYILWQDNLDLIMKTAYLHYIKGHYAKSYYLSGQALQLNPKNSEAALYAALSAANMGKTGEARQLFELAVDSKPQIPEAFYNFALFLKKEKDYVSAFSVYKKYEQIFGPSLDVWLAVAGLYEIQGLDSEACNQYKAILKSGFTMDKKTNQIIKSKVQTLCR